MSLPDGRDLGRKLIAEGFGTVYVYRRAFQRLAAYEDAERAARNGRRGLLVALPF